MLAVRRSKEAGFHVPASAPCLTTSYLEDSLKLQLLGGTALLGILLVSLAGCTAKADGTDVMAKVNGKKILRADVDRYYDNQTAGQKQAPTPEQAQALKLNIVQKLIDDEILIQRAEKDGLLATDDDVQKRLTELKAPYTEDQFQARLKERHLSLEEFKQEMRRAITVEKVLNKEVTSHVEVTDANILEYYNEHKADFNVVEPQYHVAHIQVTSSPLPQAHNLKNSKAQNDAEAHKKIVEIQSRLDNGEDFATVAVNWSEDPNTAANGGDLGNIPESGLKSTDAATRDIVLKLKPGQYSPVIQIKQPPNGYRIVKLIDKLPAGQRDVNDPRVHQFIRDRLRQNSEQLLRAAFFEVVHNGAKIEDFYAQMILKEQGTAGR